MGSEKYPAENGFDAFLKKHGGSDNASTDCERTIFQFDVQRKYFREALDRWGRLRNSVTFPLELYWTIFILFPFLLVDFNFEIYGLYFEFILKRQKPDWSWGCGRALVGSVCDWQWTISRHVGVFLSEHEFSGVPPSWRMVSCACVDGSSLRAIWLSDGRSTGSLEITTSAQPLSNRPSAAVSVATLSLLLFLDQQSVDWKHWRVWRTRRCMQVNFCIKQLPKCSLHRRKSGADVVVPLHRAELFFTGGLPRIHILLICQSVCFINQWIVWSLKCFVLSEDIQFPII